MLDECTPIGRLVYLINDGVEFPSAHERVCLQFNLSVDQGEALTTEFDAREARNVSFLDPQPAEGLSAGSRSTGAGVFSSGSRVHFVAGIEIHTDCVYPPIPSRNYDWNATTANYEEGDRIGFGSTEREAIDDLIEDLGEDIEHACYACGEESTHEIRTRSARGWVWLDVCDECDQDEVRA